MRTIKFIIAGFILLSVGCKQDLSRTLPSFNILLKDSVTSMNTARIHGGKPLMLINFEADCKHCQDETDSLLKYVHQFPETNFCFVNMISIQQVKIFSEYYKFDDYPNVLIGQDTGKIFPRFIKSRTTPMSAVFDKRRNMIAAFAGKAKMSDLLPILKKLN